MYGHMQDFHTSAPGKNSLYQTKNMLWKALKLTKNAIWEWEGRVKLAILKKLFISKTR